MKLTSRQITFDELNEPTTVGFLNSQIIERYTYTTSEHAGRSSQDKTRFLEKELSESDLQFYHNLKTQIPAIESTDASNNSSYNVSNYSIVPFQNYYAKQYEQIMKDLRFIDAPNCYVSMKNGQPGDEGLQRHFGNKVISKLSFKGIIQKMRSKFLPSDLSVIQSTRKTIFTKSYNPITKSFLNNFPFGIKLSFDHYHPNDGFKKTLRKLDLTTTMMEEYDSIIKLKKQMSVSIPSSLDTQNQTIEYDTIDLINIMNVAPLSYENQSNSLFVGGLKPHSSYGDNLRSALLKTYLSTIIANNTTSFLDFARGTETYSETLFYKIEKFLGTNSDSNVVQTIYVPADNQYATYYDTQVKIGETYTYSVSTVMACVGSKYGLNSITENSMESQVEIINEPEVVLMEVPLFEDTVVMSAYPPLVPFVHFYTKNNSENSINIRMNMPIGVRYDDFITIEDNDSLQIEMMNSPRGTSLYGYSYLGTEKITYDVYRTKKPPRSYEDFIGKKYLERVEANINDVLNFTDKVMPNQKYYYLFRALNHYGMKSNPTPIYVVELLKDSDDSKIVMDTYKFPMERLSQQFVTMKRLLQITPAPQHVIFDADELMTNKYGETFNGSLDELKYGIAQKPVWGRKFKIRITSNDTGRKIDVNVLFKLIKKKLNEDLV